LGGVLGAEGMSEGVSIRGISNLGAGIMLCWLPEDCREWVGGVGGRPLDPIRFFDACFKVRGLDVSELGMDATPVSIARSRGNAAGVKGYVWCLRSPRG
jgi:hypothetical protein